MLDHIRHLYNAVSYNKSAAVRPSKFVSLAGAWWRNEMAFLRRTSRLSTVLGVDGKRLEELFEESRTVMAYCATELRRYQAVLPGLLNPNYGPVLYACIRVLRPDVVVETGVGSGVSSTFYLNAMERNGAGRLYSVDLPLPNERLLPEERRTGWLVPDELRHRWELTLGDAKEELPAILARLEEVDCFYHDSDHSHEHMTWEFTTAHPHVRPGWLVLSDDVTNNSAWDEFAAGHAGISTRINRTGVFKKG